MKRKSIFVFTLISFGLVIGLLIAAKFDLSPTVQSQTRKAILEPQESAPLITGMSIESAVIDVADMVGEAVVSISTEQIRHLGGRRGSSFGQPNGKSPFGEDEFFRKFFDDFLGEMPEREYRQMGLGSGVIIDAGGFILTNEHVIRQADKITVTLADGREFKGEVKGRDTRSDLAVIKIAALNLPFAKLGDSAALRIGQWVVAIGNPYAFAMDNPEPTVTVGVISALNRSLGRMLSRNRDYSDLIQTDAAINPGNSGGPLVNLKGEIVGINVAIFSTSGGYQGIGFAIPVNNAKRIISRLIEGKKILYGWLGVTVQDLTDDLAEYFGLADKTGVLVAKVLDDGPAKDAGMKDGDVIKSFDAKPIDNVKELLAVVARTEVGRKVKVEVVREKKKVKLEVKIGERPESIEENQESTPKEAAESSVWRGIRAQDPGMPAFGRQSQHGVIVVSVEPGSPADEAGIVARDIILEINKVVIKGVSDYRKITSGLKDKDALIKTERGFFLVKEEKQSEEE
ncbi:Do family serine endopeptidase [Candidatus Omnitrophota bacterium]